MNEEKPLHVQVAEALGDEMPERHERDEAPHGYSACVHCGQTAHWEAEFVGPCVRRYDTDWAATGPLIDAHVSALFVGWSNEWGALWHACDSERDCVEFGTHSLVVRSRDREPHGEGETPLVAVCNLILALKKAGKL